MIKLIAIVPVRNGGSNHIVNLRLIHEQCRVDKDYAEQKGLYSEPIYDDPRMFKINAPLE